MAPCRWTHFRASDNMPEARSKPAQNTFPWALNADLLNGLAIFRLAFKWRATLAAEIRALLHDGEK